MADRFDRLNNSSPAEQQLQADRVSVGRTAFDYSCIHNGNAIIGALTPVDCFDVVPNEDIDLSLASLLEFRNPTTRQLFNGMRVYFHAYYNRLTDLWEGAKNWLDNGRRGDISLSRPSLLYKTLKTDMPLTKGSNACTPLSLLNYLGLPAQVIIKNKDSNSNVSIWSPIRQFEACFTVDEESDLPTNKPRGIPISDNASLSALDDFFPADCAMAYQRNWRDFYSNKNLLQNNPYWFPDNEDHFILSYSCEYAVCINYENESLGETDINNKKIASNIIGGDSVLDPELSISSTPECNNPSTYPSNQWGNYPVKFSPNLSALKFRQFKGDRFTACSPFPDLIRGNIPVLDFTLDSLSNVKAYNTDGTQFTGNFATETHPSGYNQTGSADNNGVSLLDTNGSDKLLKVDLSLTSSITMSDIYTLETLTAFRRRLGLTNGDYNEMIKAQYGVSPNVTDRRGTYIGGFYQDFAFSSVTQQSQSTSDSPLGTKAGQGVSSGSGTIGHFHSPDFGWIQIYMSIVPDVYYTQGKPRQYSKKSNLEMYFPLFNNLPSQGIRNDELYISNTSSTNESPFAYEDRYAEFKSRHNRVSGFMGLSHDVASYDASRVIARRFSSTPSFNSDFVTMIPENVDMNVFSVVNEPPFDFSIGISCRRVAPMPYTAIEGSLSSPLLNNMGA